MGNRNVTYDRPVNAKLMVVLEDGETWEAKPEDVRKFGYVDYLDAYTTFERTLREQLVAGGVLSERSDLTEAALNPVRYLVELCLCYPHLIAHPENAEFLQELVELERGLQVYAAAKTG